MRATIFEVIAIDRMALAYDPVKRATRVDMICNSVHSNKNCEIFGNTVQAIEHPDKMSQGSRTQVKYIVSADGTRLYSDAVGNPSSPALVFVHGLGTTAVCFDTIFRNPQFSADHFLVYPFQPRLMRAHTEHSFFVRFGMTFVDMGNRASQTQQRDIRRRSTPKTSQQ